ncbi:MAG: hypothetical protein D9N11_12640, partial [Ketobacter sp.]
MNSIFLRIYGGMVVVCLVIGVAFYVALEAINFFRLQYYRSALITGPVQLIADLTASQPEDYRERWVQEVGHMLDSRMSLLSLDQIDLTNAQKEELRDNKVVLRVVDEFNREGEAIVAIPYREGTRYLVAKGEYLTEQQGRGMAELIAQYLSR